MLSAAIPLTFVSEYIRARRSHIENFFKLCSLRVLLMLFCPVGRQVTCANGNLEKGKVA